MARTTTLLKGNEPTTRLLALIALLYLIPSVQAMLPIDDPDIWWRFRMGEWIVEKRAVPYVDYFSAHDVGKPWIEYSWLFALIVYAVQAKFGLTGVVYFVVAMGLIIAFAAHQLLRRAGLPVQLEVVLTAMALAAMKPLMSPRPWLFTIGFFIVELLVIMRVRSSGNDRSLWVLPPLFVLWANSHIQFVYGLAVIGMLFAESLVLRLKWFGSGISVPPLSAARLALVTFTCTLATLLTPYHYLLYKQVVDYIGGQTGAFNYISELHPMFFRSPTDWLVLLLALSGAFALGWQRAWRPFPTLLLLMGAFLAFRARRDAWVLAIAAIGIIGDSNRDASADGSYCLTKGQMVFSAVVVALTLGLVSLGRQINETNLHEAVEKKFPVKAVRFIKANGLAGPLFNHLDWGGFLIWQLREPPVVMDGRINLYGDERVERSLNTWQAGPGWETDPELIKANLVIGDKARPLVSRLRDHPGYKVVYEDNIAVVFVSVR